MIDSDHEGLGQIFKKVTDKALHIESRKRGTQNSSDSDSKDKALTFELHVVTMGELNACALPGGIVVFSEELCQSIKIKLSVKMLSPFSLDMRLLISSNTTISIDSSVLIFRN